MSLETKATKQGVKLGLKLADIYRRWRTRLAWKRNASKRPASLSVVLLALAASGCASLDNSYIAMDDRLFDGSQNPNRYLVPQGYEVKAFVRDASGDRVDVTGWTVEEEMVKADGWTPRPLEIAPRGRQQDSAIRDVLELVREQQTAAPTSDNAAAAEQAIIDAAKSAGVAP